MRGRGAERVGRGGGRGQGVAVKWRRGGRGFERLPDNVAVRWADHMSGLMGSRAAGVQCRFGK